MGVGLATSAAFVALNHYFKRRRGQAVGLSMAGTALGMLIMPQLVRILLEEYSFRGAVLILSGLAFNSLVGATLLQPIKRHLKEEDVDIELELKEMTTIKEEEDELPEIKTLLFNDRPVNNIKKNFSEANMGGMDVVNRQNGKGYLPKRPTFPRIVSVSSMSMETRKRKESVISSLSYLDFNGSSLQVHVDVSITYKYFIYYKKKTIIDLSHKEKKNEKSRDVFFFN